MPQVYFRFEDERQSYPRWGLTQGGSVELNTRPFHELFRLDTAPGTERTERTERTGWDRFLVEARVKQDRLIGHRDELDRIKGGIKQACRSNPTQPGRIGWLHGAPGLPVSGTVYRSPN